MTTLATITALPRIINWQRDPAKVAEFSQWEMAWVTWHEKLSDVFPNASLLHPLYEPSAYKRLQEWQKENPYPARPFCPQCGHPPHPNEARWCCNKFCEGYLL